MIQTNVDSSTTTTFFSFENQLENKPKGVRCGSRTLVGPRPPEAEEEIYLVLLFSSLSLLPVVRKTKFSLRDSDEPMDSMKVLERPELASYGLRASQL